MLQAGVAIKTPEQYCFAGLEGAICELSGSLQVIMLLPTSCQLPSSPVWLALHPSLSEATISASGALTVLQ